MPPKATTITIILRCFAVLLLLFNGAGALFGGWNLMMYTDGSTLQLSPKWLEHTPFENYFIPGIILFSANGLLSIFTVTSLFLNIKNHELLIAGQGMVLAGWILIQIILIRTFHVLHFILGSVGIALIIVGYLLWSIMQKKQTLS